jgi:hypothetical protein
VAPRAAGASVSALLCFPSIFERSHSSSGASEGSEHFESNASSPLGSDDGFGVPLSPANEHQVPPNGPRGLSYATELHTRVEAGAASQFHQMLQNSQIGIALLRSLTAHRPTHNAAGAPGPSAPPFKFKRDGLGPRAARRHPADGALPARARAGAGAVARDLGPVTRASAAAARQTKGGLH